MQPYPSIIVPRRPPLWGPTDVPPLWLPTREIIIPRESAAAYVTNSGNTSAPTSQNPTVTSGVNPTSANFLITVLTMNSANTISSVPTDTFSNTYQAGPTATNGNLKAFLYYAENITGGGANTVTWHLSASTTVTVFYLEYSGIATSGSLDQVSTGSGSGTSPSSGATPTTTQADELLFGFANAGGAVTYTAGASFTLRQTGTRAGTEEQIVAATGAYTATFTIGTNTWACGIATFKAAGAAAATTTNRRLLMGAGI